jgi:hypothetical protein
MFTLGAVAIELDAPMERYDVTGDGINPQLMNQDGRRLMNISMPSSCDRTGLRRGNARSYFQSRQPNFSGFGAPVLLYLDESYGITEDKTCQYLPI